MPGPQCWRKMGRAIQAEMIRCVSSAGTEQHSMSEEQKRQHATRLKQAGTRSSACKHVEDYGPHPMWNWYNTGQLRKEGCVQCAKIMMATMWRMSWRREWVGKAAGKLLLFSIVMVQYNRRHYIDLDQRRSSINGEKWLHTRWLWVIRER